MDDLISILLPLYNAETTLLECLESIQRQTYSNFEVIAVDDGSDDASPLILENYALKDPRIKTVSLPGNQGIVTALNRGLAQCQGKWVARMDADDRMHPERLRLQRVYFEQHPDTDLLGGRVKIFRLDGALTPGQTRYQDWSNSLLTDQEIKSEIFAESPLMHPTFFLRKSYYQRLGGYRKTAWAEDYDFLLRAYLQNAIFAKIPQVLLEKRDSPTRLARLDVRCKRRAMFQAKAHFFARTNWLQKKKRLILIGAGSSGRLVKAALSRENIRVDGFADNRRTEADRTVTGVPVEIIDPEHAKSYFLKHSDSFFLLCIGVPKGREKVEAWLKQYGFLVGRDYLRFI